MTFEDDKLNREKYADFLTEIIKTADKYKSIADSESLNIAIDSSWGSGKSTFLEMWENKLKTLKNENGQELFEIVRYNAWKNDFLDNPIESIIYTIVNSKLFKDQNQNKQIKESLIENSGKVIKSFIKSGTQILAGEFIGEFIESLINQTENFVSDLNDSKSVYKNLYTNYNNFFESVDVIKNLLEPITKDTPIIFIIDELDRCKPIFAIKILESIKHIFDIKNITFIFALDMQQLSCSVKSIYGNEIDANGYLAKFFDYISKLPKPDLDLYIKYLTENKKLNRELFKYDLSYNKEIGFSDIFINISKSMNLSLRDINTIYSNFLIFEKLELSSTNSIYAYSLYMFFIILKYKNVDDYRKILFDGDFSSIRNKYQFIKLPIFNNILQDIVTLNFTQEISENHYKLLNRNYVVQNSFLVIDIVGKCINCNVYKDGYRRPIEQSISEECSLSNILFWDDLKKWNEIKEFTLGQYIQQKLEFFNFENIDK